MQYVRKTITLKVEHAEWIKVHSINLSRFVQQKIEEEMKKLG
jgi:post-segregation antitoxin (ccd killing protein)